jgi:hypothetical protein
VLDQRSQRLGAALGFAALFLCSYGQGTSRARLAGDLGAVLA